MSAFELRTPYLLFLGSARERADVKTAAGIHHWRPDSCLAEVALEDCQVTLGLPSMRPQEAADAGARSLVIGTVSGGGLLPDEWMELLGEAIDAGLDLVSGMHRRLGSIDALVERSTRRGVRLVDLREPRGIFPVGEGVPRSGRRLLTVGTDCNVGKMYTALAVDQELRDRGVDAEFKATGQTGILIVGGGVPVDAVVSDFISGAVETLCPAVADGCWQVIEGQGSLHHPAYAGVTLGLIHGAQPDVLVVCHEPTRRHMRHAPGRGLPSLARTMAAALEAAALTNPAVRCAGFSVNTSALEPEAARRLLDDIESEHRLPATDPVRWGVGDLVDQVLGGDRR